MNKCICLRDKEFDFGSNIGGCRFLAKILLYSGTIIVI